MRVLADDPMQPGWSDICSEKVSNSPAITDKLVTRPNSTKL